MAKVATKNGAKIHLKTTVKKIITKSKVAKGILLENGEEIPYDSVIINADF